jgi:hypothetical protein
MRGVGVKRLIAAATIVGMALLVTTALPGAFDDGD